MHLKQSQQQVLFARRKGSSVQSDEHRVQKVLHLINVDEIDELGDVARLCLQQIKELLIGFDLLLVGGKVGHLDLFLALLLLAFGLFLLGLQLAAVANEQSDALVQLGQIALQHVVFADFHGELLLELLNLLHPVHLVGLGSVLQDALNLSDREISLLFRLFFETTTLRLQLNLVFALAQRHQIAQQNAVLQQQQQTFALLVVNLRRKEIKEKKRKKEKKKLIKHNT